MDGKVIIALDVEIIALNSKLNASHLTSKFGASWRLSSLFSFVGTSSSTSEIDTRMSFIIALRASSDV